MHLLNSALSMQVWQSVWRLISWVELERSAIYVVELYTAGTSGPARSGNYILGDTLHIVELRCHSGVLKSSDKLAP